MGSNIELLHAFDFSDCPNASRGSSRNTPWREGLPYANGLAQRRNISKKWMVTCPTQTGNENYDARVTTCDYELDSESVISPLLEVLAELAERVSTS